MIKAYIFDMDNTLVDTWDLIYNSFLHTFNTHNLPRLTQKELIKRMGPTAIEVYKEFAHNITAEELLETHRKFASQNLHLATIYTHTLSTLQTLKKKKMKLGIVTARSKLSSIDILKRSGIFELFDAVVSAEDVINAKPHPDHVLKALEILIVKPNEAVMVGDTIADIQSGKGAGTFTVGVTYGFHKDTIKDAKPDYLITDIKDILTILT